MAGFEPEYHDDIVKAMHKMEEEAIGSVCSMDEQPQIMWYMRPELIGFLLEVHFFYHMRPETLYLGLNILDRYLSKRVCFLRHYQLVGCTALWIASKFEDAKEHVPRVSALVKDCLDAYPADAFIAMEIHIMNTIGWKVGHPTAEAWLRLACTGREDAKVQHVARFLMEITVFYREFIEYPSSVIASGALCLSRYLCGKGLYVEDETTETLEIVHLLDSRLSKRIDTISPILINKYSFAFFSQASTFVMRYYLEGGCISREQLVPLPTTPKRSSSSSSSLASSPVSASSFSTPMSASTSASDLSDDMPATPTSPDFETDANSGLCVPDSDKENLPSSPALEFVLKHATEPVPDQFLPHDLLACRQALHSLNSSPPPSRPSAV